MIDFYVMGTPVAMPRPRVVRTPSGKTRTYNSSKSTTYKQMIKIHAKNAMNKAHKSMTERPLKMELTFFFKPPKSYTKKKLRAVETGELRYTKLPDADNLAKTVMDALNKLLYKDDSQIVELSVKKRIRNRGRVSSQSRRNKLRCGD